MSGNSHFLCVLLEVSVCWCDLHGIWWVSNSSRALWEVAIFRQHPVVFSMKVFTEVTSVFLGAETLVFPGFTKIRVCVPAFITKFAPISFGFVRISQKIAAYIHMVVPAFFELAISGQLVFAVDRAASD